MAEQGRHVLIVEDEQDERDALRALLEVWEPRVEEAENGARGIELALDHRSERGMTSLLRAGLGLLVMPLVVAGCVHRAMPNTDSGASGTPIPTEAEHRFRAARTA